MVILQTKVARLNPGSLERFVLRAKRAVGLHGSADVLVTSSVVMRALNRRFRGKDKATDVLSFPSLALGPPNGKGTTHAGDIAISGDIAKQNAARLGHSGAEEVKVLILHGILHLAGFDHERDNGEMARKEMKLREEFGLPVALLQRFHSDKSQSSTEQDGRTRPRATRRKTA